MILGVPPLMYTVTWTASDESGNTASAEQTVTIVDTIPPLIAAPEDIILEAQNPNRRAGCTRYSILWEYPR